MISCNGPRCPVPKAQALQTPNISEELLKLKGVIKLGSVL